MRISVPLSILTLAITTITFGSACSEPEPEPPSDPPVLEAPEVECGPATAEMAQAYDIDYPVILSVSVQVSDPQRDLVEDSVRGEVNGYPIPLLTDDDADLRYTWTPPSELAPMVCRGEVVVRFEARDLDENTAEITEILTK